MYAGFFTSKHAATWLGAHQKFNRASYKTLKKLAETEPDLIGVAKLFSKFPRLKLIQHFEGQNGPDGIKVKSPAQDEPWHYYDPFDEEDTQIFSLIDQHFHSLVEALKNNDQEKSAFEASWLAHTITDGLTPAHHYPYEQELSKLFGHSKEGRNTKTKKLIARGETFLDTVRRNWRMHGRKGLLSTHIGFELGITSVILPYRINSGLPSALEISYAQDQGIVKVFEKYAEQIAKLNLYGKFYRYGWTPKIARDVRFVMSPLIVRTITLAWMLALERAGTE